MGYFYDIQRLPFYLDDNNIVFSFLAVLWVTFFVAFATSMAFEGPFLGLEKLVLAFFGWVGSLCGGKDSGYDFDQPEVGDKKTTTKL